MKRLLAISLLAAACATEPAAQDGPDDSFVGSGKADTDGIAEGSPEAVGVLALVNEVSFAVLDNDVGLASNAAHNIVAYRLGDDEIAGTGDDERFDTLAELDAIPYVGPAAWQHLLAYAEAHGYVAAPQPGDAPATPQPTASAQRAGSCSETISAWHQTCFAWKPCYPPMTDVRTDNGTTTVTVACSLAGASLACTVSSTDCTPHQWRFIDNTVTGDVAADGSFVLESDGRVGDTENYSWHRYRIPGRVIENGTTTTVVLDQVRADAGYYITQVSDGPTTVKTSDRKSVQSSTMSLVLSP